MKTIEPPQYRLTEPAYINDQLFDQGAVDAGAAIIFFEGVPGYHMFPLNDAARAMVKKHNPQRVDPLDALTVVAAPVAAAATAASAAKATVVEPQP